MRALLLFLLLPLLYGQGEGKANGCYAPDLIWPKVVKWSQAYGLDPHLVYVVVWKESRFCAGALGSKGEIGLGQIKPETALFLGVPPEYLWNPDWNLMVTAKYLRYLYQRFRSWEKALMAYNAGPSRVVRNEVPSASVAYARHILWAYGRIKP